MIEIAGPFNSGDAVGGDGVATINADTPTVLDGLIRGIYIKYNDSPPAGTTDVTIATKGTNAPAMTLLALANGATSGWRWPKALINLNTDGSQVAANYDLIAVHDIINILIAQANAGDNIDVWFLIEV